MHLPQQKLRRIVKAEHVIIILHVVLIQESVQLLQLNRREAGENKKHLNTLGELYCSPLITQSEKKHTLTVNHLDSHMFSADLNDIKHYCWLES